MRNNEEYSLDSAWQNGAAGFDPLGHALEHPGFVQ